MRKCPHCQNTEKQVKNGKTTYGSQLYKCKFCNRKYTPEPKQQGYPAVQRQQALRLVLDGNSQRQAARHTGVSHGTIANWVKAYADNLSEELPKPNQFIEVAEQDEIFTFIGKKKRKSIS